MSGGFAEVAFTPAVQALQESHGSRAQYARMQAKAEPGSGLGPDESEFLAAADSFYLATVSETGWPYVQHRGGPPGFLVPLDDHTLAFPDCAGNRQYITVGNLAENPRAYIFAMDYINRRRVKIWGRARIVGDDPALLDRVMPSGYPART